MAGAVSTPHGRPPWRPIAVVAALMTLLIVTISGNGAHGASATSTVVAGSTTCTTDATGMCAVSLRLLYTPVSIEISPATALIASVDTINRIGFFAHFLTPAGQTAANQQVTFGYLAYIGGQPGNAPTPAPIPSTSAPASNSPSPSSSASPSPSPTQPPGGGGSGTDTPVFDEECNSAAGALSGSNWVYDTGGNWDNGATAQQYTNRTANSGYDGNGNCYLKAARETYTGSDGITRSYTSARVTTNDRYTFGSGSYEEIRAKVPNVAGTWPAFWAMPTAGWPPEIDGLEVASDSGHNYPHTNLHLGPNGAYQSGWVWSGAPTGLDLSQWHAYGWYADQSKLDFYIDGAMVREILRSSVPSADGWIFDKGNLELILNVAVGGAGGDPVATAFPQQMTIDYVRGYSSAPSYLSGPLGQTGAWKLPFHDEFTGSQIDTTKWVLCNPSFSSSCVPYNNEQERYNTTLPPAANPNVVVSGGQLHLVATRTNGQIASGMVATGPNQFGANQPGYQSFQFQYGFYEGRVRLPRGDGYWPSLWELADQTVYGPWPGSGEEDVFEVAGNDPTTVHMTEHDAVSAGAGDSVTTSITNPDTSQDFHVYGFDWEPDHMAWYIDGHLARSMICTSAYSTAHPGMCDGYGANNPFSPNHPMYIIANLSVGGLWPPLNGAPDGSTPFPASMDIDWLRVWQH